MEKTVYTVDEIRVLLFLSKNKAYELVRSKAFPVVRVGACYRIPKKGFDEWLMATDEKAANI